MASLGSMLNGSSVEVMFGAIAVSMAGMARAMQISVLELA
jgi:hypothetical protein